MRRLLLFVGVGSLAFSLACGGGSSNGGGFGSGGGTGSFSNASLSGQYTYQLKGYSLSSQSPFREAGVFTADGSGHLTNLVDDIAGGGSASTASTTGSYQINPEGSGTLTMNFSSGNATFEVTLSSSSQLYLVEIDSSLTGVASSGMAQKQDASAFANPPSGTFIFRIHTLTNPQTALNPTSTVGAFTVSGGNITSGNMDSQHFNGPSSSTVTGSFNGPDTTGRGTGTLTDTSNGTLAFNYYVIDANHLVLFSIQPAIIGIGVAEKQTGSPFTNASFSGPYAFGSSGDTSTFFEQTNTAGQFNADGTGNITAGVLDNVTDGTPATTTTGLPFTGTYQVAANGRVNVTLNANAGSIQQVYWLVSPNRAFFVTDSPNSVEDGSLDSQVGTFTNASLNGLYAYEMDGFDSSLNNTKERLGVMNANGNGSLSVGQIANAAGTVSNTTTPLTGSYSVGTNGRVTASVNNLSNNLVFYLISGSKGYILQNDTGVSIGGTMIKQP
ncbi:MAG TPA: hypothetical protein VLK33_06415 [Terriglobales bacterium]|nr:hypothetical protein [Terriglobales bacterium]